MSRGPKEPVPISGAYSNSLDAIGLVVLVGAAAAVLYVLLRFIDFDKHFVAPMVFVGGAIWIAANAVMKAYREERSLRDHPEEGNHYRPSTHA